MDHVTCAECQHREPADSTCHREPPSAGWPTVLPTDWCGEATRIAPEPVVEE